MTTDPTHTHPEFLQGVAWAAAFVTKAFDQPGIAQDMLREAGFTLAEYERAGVDAETDLHVIRKLL